MFLNNDYNLLTGVLIFSLRYFLIAGAAYFIFYVWNKNNYVSLRFKKNEHLSKQIKTELFYSCSTLLIYSISVYALILWYKYGLTKIYPDLETFGYWYFGFSVFAMVILHDTYFYWSHKLMHKLPFLFRFHKIHHFSHNPNPWSAFSFHPVEAVISLGIVPIIVFTIPVHPYALFVFSTFVTIYNVYIHIGFKVKFFFLGISIQNTAENHDLHHRKSKYNYGLYFSFWDRIMKTYK